MKVGIICYPSYGGSGVVATELGRQLAARGHFVHFISYDVPFKLSTYEANVTFHEVDIPSYPLFAYPPYLLALANKVVEVSRRYSLDILHAHYAIPHATCGFLAREVLGGRLKVVTTLHGTDVTLLGSNPSFSDIIRFSIESSDGVTAVSQDLARVTRELFDIRSPIEVIYNFVDASRFRPLEVEDLRSRICSPETRVLVHISNFRPVKQPVAVIDIFHAVQQELPAVLLLVGDGPEMARVQQRVDELGIAQRVKFLGKQEEVVEILSLSDLMLLPSTQESFGLVALEAMACQVPVIASRVGGLPEVVVHGRAGFLYSPADLEGMAQGAITILSDPALREEMGLHARAIAVEKFSADEQVARYERYYEQVLENEV